MGQVTISMGWVLRFGMTGFHPIPPHAPGGLLPFPCLSEGHSLDKYVRHDNVEIPDTCMLAYG